MTTDAVHGQRGAFAWPSQNGLQSVQRISSVACVRQASGGIIWEASKWALAWDSGTMGCRMLRTLLEYIDKAEAWGIDSVWLSDHLMGPRPEVAVMPMMAAIAARTQRLKFGPSVHDVTPPSSHYAWPKKSRRWTFWPRAALIMAVGLGADEHEAAAFNVPAQTTGRHDR